MDKIFKALNDPARRALLDSLRAQDGQSLSQLEDQLAMSRFGVMKHLKVLEEADLVIARRQGRFKIHHLNPMPLQELRDRWVAPFLQPKAEALSDLKTRLEWQNAMGHPDVMLQTAIRCTQEALWAALTQADQIARYHVMSRTVDGNLRLGQVTRHLAPDGTELLRYTTTATQPQTRIAMTLTPHFLGRDATPSQLSYEITSQGATCWLKIAQYQIAPGQDGWALLWASLAAALKSYLETGTAMQAAM